MYEVLFSLYRSLVPIHSFLILGMSRLFLHAGLLLKFWKLLYIFSVLWCLVSLIFLQILCFIVGSHSQSLSYILGCTIFLGFFQSLHFFEGIIWFLIMIIIGSAFLFFLFLNIMLTVLLGEKFRPFLIISIQLNIINLPRKTQHEVDICLVKELLYILITYIQIKWL